MRPTLRLRTAYRLQHPLALRLAQGGSIPSLSKREPSRVQHDAQRKAAARAKAKGPHGTLRVPRASVLVMNPADLSALSAATPHTKGGLLVADTVPVPDPRPQGAKERFATPTSLLIRQPDRLRSR